MNNPFTKLVTTHHTIRGIETDATSTVAPGWISRMLERVRWSVFGLDTFVLRNRVVGGVARAGVFEYSEPLRFDDEIEIETWLARVGNTSYDFGHAIKRLSDGVVAVRARVTVVHIGPDGPAPVGADLASAVLDEPVPARAVWPETERRSSWTRRWIVRPSDQDSFRHVNQARYVDYIDDTRQLASMAGEVAGPRWASRITFRRVPPGNTRRPARSDGNLGVREWRQGLRAHEARHGRSAFPWASARRANIVGINLDPRHSAPLRLFFPRCFPRRVALILRRKNSSPGAMRSTVSCRGAGSCLTTVHPQKERL